MSEDKTEILKENARDLQGDFTNLPVGEILKRQRLQLGLSAEQVQSALRIKAIYLDALEKSDFERLPGHAYAAGFIKTYSDYLGLDSHKMTQLFRKQSGRQIERPKYIFPVAADDQKIPSLKVVAASTFLLFVIFLVWHLSDPNRMTADSVPAVPKDLAKQMTAPQKPKEKKEAVAEQPKPHPIVLKATEDVWLEIRDAKKEPIFSRVLKKGEEYWVPEAETAYSMTTGNAGGLVLVLNGEAQPPMGTTGEVRRNIALDPEKLRPGEAAGE